MIFIPEPVVLGLAARSTTVLAFRLKHDGQMSRLYICPPDVATEAPSIMACDDLIGALSGHVTRRALQHALVLADDHLTSFLLHQVG